MRAANLWRRLALSVLVGLGCGPVLSAHAVGAKPAAERPPTVVSVDVVVTGPQGEPVRDLLATEVHVFEDKKEQKILFFRPRERGLPQRALLGPNEFSNRSRPRVPPPTVVLLDLLNEWFSTGAEGGIEVGKALERLEPVSYTHLPNRLAELTMNGGKTSMYPCCCVCRSSMKLASARSNFAPSPKYTAKRAPVIFAARSKSRMPSSGPRSQCVSYTHLNLNDLR